MVIIAEMNCLVKGLSDNQKKVIGNLTGKDKLFLICDTEATVSMDVLEMFMGLSVKPQFIKLDLADRFALGYRYGVLAMTYAKEQITVISEEDYSSVFDKNISVLKAGSKAPAKKAAKAQPAAKTPVQKEVPAEAKAPKVAKAAAPAKEKTPVAKKEAPAAKAETPSKTSASDAGRTSKIRLKDLTNDSLLRKYLGLSAYADKIKRMGEGKIKEAVEKAQDGDATFKFQLIMNFGQEDGEAIWKILKKDYSKLKSLV